MTASAITRPAKLVTRCFDSKDYVEGRTAFMEKRKPALPAPETCALGVAKPPPKCYPCPPQKT